MAFMSLIRLRHLVVAGATGAVGREVCLLLEQRGIRYGRLTLLASPRSAGAVIDVHGTAHEVQVASADCFAGVDYAHILDGSGRVEGNRPRGSRSRRGRH